MSGTLNRVTIIGNLGRDPEVRTTPDGRKIVSFSVATSETWKGKDGERKDRTDWHNIVIYGEGLCGVAEKYLRKGSKLFVEGALQTRTWKGKDGAERQTTEIVVGGRGVLKLLDTATKKEEVNIATANDSPWDDDLPC